MTEIMRETDRQLKEMAERLRLCMLRDNMSELMNMATTAFSTRVANVFI